MRESSHAAHIRVLNDCNQRGGRTLSLLDLLDAGTVDLPLAVYLAAAMRSGASLLVGALPGGAGKTTVMCALLNFVPDATILAPVESPVVSAEMRPGVPLSRLCFVAHEISNGPVHGYLWGGEARAFFGLGAQGYGIASNLHADTLEETRDQLCRENGVPETHLDSVSLKVYLRVEQIAGGSTRRWVRCVHESDGAQDRLLFSRDEEGLLVRQEGVDSVLASKEREHEYARFLSKLRQKGLFRIEDVRRALLDGLNEE
ncbi:MAG: hypothetical protein V1800_15940 [Candidatus Latescibacterota bacterium]